GFGQRQVLELEVADDWADVRVGAAFIVQVGDLANHWFDFARQPAVQELVDRLWALDIVQGVGLIEDLGEAPVSLAARAHELLIRAAAAAVQGTRKLGAQLPLVRADAALRAAALATAAGLAGGEEVADRVQGLLPCRLLRPAAEEVMELRATVPIGGQEEADQGSEEDGVKHRHAFLCECRGTAVPAPAERLVEAQGLADALRVEA